MKSSRNSSCFLLPFFVSVFWVCVHVCGRVHVCECLCAFACVYACQHPGLISNVIPRHFSTLFAEVGVPHQTRSLQLVLIATFISGNPLSWSSEAGITGKPRHKPSIRKVFWESKLQSLHLNGECFNHQAISPAPRCCF